MGNMGFQEALIIIFGLAFLVFDILMIIDAAGNKNLSTLAKTLWTLGIILISPVVAVVYYFTARTKSIR